MKIAAISDTHGNKNVLIAFCEMFKSADLLVHLGDGFADYCYIKEKYRDLPFIFVTGNNDFNSDQPKMRFFEIEGVKVFAVHGNGYGVKRDLSKLKAKAIEKGADVALFGHTHEPHCSFQDGIYLCNPGGACYAAFSDAYAVVIEKNENGLNCYLTEIV